MNPVHPCPFGSHHINVHIVADHNRVVGLSFGKAVALAFDDGRRQWLRPVAVLGPSEAFEIPFELERD